MDAWWFEPADGKLGYGDGRKPEKGVTHKVDCKPVLCEAGLHGSARLLDALDYAGSSVVWRVRLGGTIVYGDDKSTATERTYLERYEIEDILRAFARWCALQVVDKWDAARYAAWDAARYAARYAAWDAAMNAAMNAAWDAARYAARYAAWDAAWDAAWERCNAKLEAMVLGGK